MSSDTYKPRFGKKRVLGPRYPNMVNQMQTPHKKNIGKGFKSAFNQYNKKPISQDVTKMCFGPKIPKYDNSFPHSPPSPPPHTKK